MFAAELSFSCASGDCWLPSPPPRRKRRCAVLPSREAGRRGWAGGGGGSPAGGHLCLPPTPQVLTSCVLSQAHPHLPCCLPGLRMLCLLWCCLRDPWAGPRHQVLAQREMGLHRRPLRVPPVCQQEVARQDHVMAGQGLASLLVSPHAPGFTCRRRQPVVCRVRGRACLCSILFPGL